MTILERARKIIDAFNTLQEEMPNTSTLIDFENVILVSALTEAIDRGAQLIAETTKHWGRR
jgi:hypothetical protein